MREAVDRVCARAGIEPGEIKRFIHLNDNQQAMADIARALKVPLERFNGDLALDLGHFGSADQMLALNRMMQAGELQAGDVVALTTLGGGMHWAVTLLRI